MNSVQDQVSGLTYPHWSLVRDQILARVTEQVSVYEQSLVNGRVFNPVTVWVLDQVRDQLEEEDQ